MVHERSIIELSPIFRPLPARFVEGTSSFKQARRVVTNDEVNAFKEVFKVPHGEMKIARIFNLAKQEDVTGFETYVDQIAALLKDDRKLLQHVLEGLLHVAAADGIMHPKEDEFSPASAMMS